MYPQQPVPGQQMQYPQQPQQGYPPQPQPQPPVDREFQGMLVNMEVKTSGWWRFHVLEPGKQYPLKLDTKKPELIEQARSLIGQPVAVQIREQESNTINEKTGRPFMNRYLNAIAPAGFAPGVQPQQGAQGPQGQVYQPPQQQGYQNVQPQPQQYPTPTHSEPIPQVRPGMMGLEKDINIMRQAAAKVVAMSFEHLPAEQRNIQGMIEACETWLAYFVQGPLRFGVTPFDQPRQPQAQPPQEQQGGGSEYNPGYASQNGPQADIFGAPMDAQGTPLYGDPGREQGDPGPGY